MIINVGMTKKEKEEELKQQVKRLEAKYSALQVVPIISKIGQDQQGDIAAEGQCVWRSVIVDVWRCVIGLRVVTLYQLSFLLVSFIYPTSLLPVMNNSSFLDIIALSSEL